MMEEEEEQEDLTWRATHVAFEQTTNMYKQT